jgi:tellurite resistance protein
MNSNKNTNKKTTTPPFNGKNQVSTQVSNSVANTGDGVVNFSNYVENNDFLDTLTQEEENFFKPTLHQHSENSEQSDSDEDSNTLKPDPKNGTATELVTEETPKKTNDKPTAFLKKVSLLLDQNISVPVITPQGKPPLKPADKRNMASVDFNNTCNDPTTKQSSIGNNILKKTLGLYSSPFLDEEFKPASNSFDLPADLELLRPLIMSQHEVFIQPIKDLSNTNLFLTKIIEKKKHSLKLLQTEQKIPRSLRIKCELTTSPSYTSAPDFSRLKEEMQDTVTAFIKKGTRIMTDWADINIKLLTQDRCSTILAQAITILEGLSSFYLEVIGTPNWKSLPSNKYIPLFLFKLYFSNEYINIENLLEYFNITLEKILFIGTTQMIGATTDEEVNLVLNAINLADIDPDDPVQEAFISETLTSFDQILKFTTIEVWEYYTEKTKQAIAAQNLKAKMKSKEITNATAATSFAIAKATDNINIENTQHLTSILRISNLEKSVKNQEQKSNQIINALKAKRSQKNLTGSYKTGSVTSPDTQTPSRKTSGHKQKIIDLSTEDTDSLDKTYQSSHNQGLTYNHPTKKVRKNNTQPNNKEKKVQWLEPNMTYASSLHPGTYLTGIAPQPPTFQPPPPPLPTPLHQLHSPFYNHQINPYYLSYQTQAQIQNPQLGIQSPFLHSQTQYQNQQFQQVQTNPFNSYNQGKLSSTRENPFGTTPFQKHS